MLFNEPKLLKSSFAFEFLAILCGFSALQRAEIAEIVAQHLAALRAERVSVLFNEPKLLKSKPQSQCCADCSVSVLFNEPKLLKSFQNQPVEGYIIRFSALQRAEIAEIWRRAVRG